MAPLMHGFSYKNGSLHCEDVDLGELAAEHGTPLYVYSAHTIVDHYRRLARAMAGVLERNFSSPRDQVSNAFLLSYNRPATSAERARSIVAAPSTACSSR